MPLLLDHKPRRGELLELVVDALSQRGLGWTELVWGDPPRRVDLEIRHALPGERVLAELIELRRGQAEARCRERLVTLPERIPGRCPHFESRPSCGGCSLQSLAYADQLRHKQSTVARAFAAAGLETVIAPILGIPHGDEGPWFYRNKMELSFERDYDDQPALGLHPVGSRSRVLQLDACFLQSPVLAPLGKQVLAWWRQSGALAYVHKNNTGHLRNLALRDGKRTGERMLVLTTSGNDVVDSANGPLPAHELARSFAEAVLRDSVELDARAWTSICWVRHHVEAGRRTVFDTTVLHGGECIHEELWVGERHLRFEIHPRSFFQPNSLQAERLYAEAVRAAFAEAEGAPAATVPTATERLGRVFDLYCGTGTLALCFADRAESVLGIELVAEAVDGARRNAASNAAENVRFELGDVPALLAKHCPEPLGPRDVVVVDPPRCGILSTGIAQLRRLAPLRIVYVSCNPFSLAADVAALGAEGYALRSLQPFDMFPHTGHVECVAALARVAS